MSQEEIYMMRKRKRIKLSEIADYINCSISLLSRYENLSVHMDREKVIKYEYFIKTYIKTK